MFIAALNNRGPSDQLWFGWAHMVSGSNLLHVLYFSFCDPGRRNSSYLGTYFLIDGNRSKEAKTNYAWIFKTFNGIWHLSHLLTLHWPKLIMVKSKVNGTVKSHGKGHGWKIIIHGGIRIVGNILNYQSLHCYSWNSTNLLLSTFAFLSSATAELGK